MKFHQGIYFVGPFVLSSHLHLLRPSLAFRLGIRPTTCPTALIFAEYDFISLHCVISLVVCEECPQLDDQFH